MNVRLRLAHGRKKVSASGALPSESSDSVLTDSPCSDTAPPTQTADLPGVVGWVMASVSILVGFGIIAGATGVDREEASNRRVNSLIPEQTTMFTSPSDPVSRDSPTPIGADIIHSRQSHNTDSIPQQSVLAEEKETLDGKEVRKALPVEVQKTMRIKPANPRRAD